MRHFPSFTYRQGILAHVNNETSGNRIDIHFKTARTTGLQMLSSLSQYFDSFTAGFNSSIDTGKSVRLIAPTEPFTKDDISGDHTPNPIFSFPEIKGVYDQSPITFQSKLILPAAHQSQFVQAWTRATIDLTNSTAGILHSSYEWVRSACSTINENLLTVLESDMSKALDQKVILDRYGRINIFAADCDDVELEDAVQRTFDNDIALETLDLDVSIALDQVATMVIPDYNGFQLGQSHFGQDMRFNTCTDRYGASGIFVSGLTKENDGVTLGLVSRGRSDRISSRNMAETILDPYTLDFLK